MPLIEPHRKRSKFTPGEGRSRTEGTIGEGMRKKRVGGPRTGESKPAALIPGALLDELAALRQTTAAAPPRDILEGLLSSRERNLPIEEQVSLLVQLLDIDDYPKIQCGVASALIDFACATSENVSVIIRGGAVPIFVRLLVSASEGVRCRAVLALSSMSCDSLERLELVLRSGALTPSYIALYCELENPTASDEADALSSFFEGSLDWTKAALPALKELIRSSDDDEVRANAFWVLGYHTGTNDRDQAVIDGGFCPILVEHFTRGPSSVSFAALAAVSCIVEGHHVPHIQAVLDHGALPRLKELLTRTDDRFVKRQAFYALTEIAAGTKEQIGAVVEAGLISTLVNLIEGKDGGLFVFMEAIRAIAKIAANGSPESISRLVREGGIKPLCDWLTLMVPSDTLECLDGLEKILEAGELRKPMSCSGVNAFAEEIRRCRGVEEIGEAAIEDDVKGKAAKILDKFFGEKEEEVPDTRMDFS